MAIDRTTRAYAAASEQAAQFRARLVRAADHNLVAFAVWMYTCGKLLRSHAQPSGPSELEGWYQRVFERDVGLMVATGAYTRACEGERP